EGLCPLVGAIARQHPLHPKLRDTANRTSCTDAVTQAEKERKSDLLSAKIPTAERVTTPELKLAEGPPITAATFDKPTVVLFFATWCPHCQREMPQIVEFAKTLSPRFKNKAALLGIRTATARDKEPYPAFATRFQINFPVRADTPDAQALSKLADAAGLTGGLPTLLVFDRKGRLAYNMQVGLHSNTNQELTWALDDLIAEP
ncbi:MAG: TlpA disulfide reductase family protein, partial [Myxococcota bacterium]